MGPQCEATLYTHKEYAFWHQRATDDRCSFVGVKGEDGKVLCARHAFMDPLGLVDYTDEDGSHKAVPKDDIAGTQAAERWKAEYAVEL